MYVKVMPSPSADPPEFVSFEPKLPLIFLTAFGKEEGSFRTISIPLVAFVSLMQKSKTEFTGTVRPIVMRAPQGLIFAVRVKQGVALIRVGLTDQVEWILKLADLVGEGVEDTNTKVLMEIVRARSSAYEATLSSKSDLWWVTEKETIHYYTGELPEGTDAAWVEKETHSRLFIGVDQEGQGILPNLDEPGGFSSPTPKEMLN